jgi:hypothetical protein
LTCGRLGGFFGFSRNFFGVAYSAEPFFCVAEQPRIGVSLIAAALRHATTGQMCRPPANRRPCSAQ